MKKILVTLFLFIPVLLFSEIKSDKELLDEISDIIADHQKKILKNDIFLIEDLWWSSIDWIYKNSEARYKTYLKKGFTYIIYTYTSGPKVQGCFKFKGGRNERCSAVGNNIIYYFKPNKSGKYYYYVRSKDNVVGSHVSYLTMLYDKSIKEKKIIEIQNYVIQDWE